MTDTPVCPSASGVPVFLGMDLGDRRSEVCVLDRASGKLVERFALDTTPAGIQARLSRFRGAPIVLEAGTHSPWVSRLLASLGLEETVANPNQLALISKSRRKTDRTDAEILARLGRSDLSLLRAVHHRSASRQAHLELLKARDALVRARTLQINHVRGALKSFGLRAPECATEAFDHKARGSVPAELQMAIFPLLRVIGFLTKTIRRHDRDIERLCKETYPETELLRAVNGVGELTSLAFVLVLGSPDRFKHSRQVGNYVGLCPGTEQSGDSDPQLHISKAGNGFLRRLLVQAAHYITGPFGQDSTLRRVGLRMMANGGSRGKRRAVVAVARKLAVMLHHLWRTGEVYDPLRDAPAPLELAPGTPKP